MSNTAKFFVLVSSIAAAVLIVVAFSIADTDPNGPAIIGSGAPGSTSGAVERQVPPAGDQVLQQQRIAIDLAVGFSEGVTLTIEKGDNPPIVIPDDELEHNVALNEWSFTPGRGKAVSQLPGDEVCVVFTYRRFDQTQNQSSRWCFEVT